MRCRRFGRMCGRGSILRMRSRIICRRRHERRWRRCWRGSGRWGGNFVSADCAEERGFATLLLRCSGESGFRKISWGVRYEVKIPTLSRQKAAGQGWGTRSIDLESEISLCRESEPGRVVFRIFLCGLEGLSESLIHARTGECYAIGGRYGSCTLFIFPVLQLRHVDVFFAVDRCAGAEQARSAGDLSAEPVSGMERDRVDRGPGVGGEE